MKDIEKRPIDKVKYKDFSTTNPNTGIPQLDEHILMVDELIEEMKTILEYEDIVSHSPIQAIRVRFKYKFVAD